MYKLAKLNVITNIQDRVIRLADNAYIPFAEDNSDYQEFLAWKSEGNTPKPADKK